MHPSPPQALATGQRQEACLLHPPYIWEHRDAHSSLCIIIYLFHIKIPSPGSPGLVSLRDHPLSLCVYNCTICWWVVGTVALGQLSNGSWVSQKRNQTALTTRLLPSASVSLSPRYLVWWSHVWTRILNPSRSPVLGSSVALVGSACCVCQWVLVTAKGLWATPQQQRGGWSRWPPMEFPGLGGRTSDLWGQQGCVDPSIQHRAPHLMGHGYHQLVNKSLQDCFQQGPSVDLAPGHHLGSHLLTLDKHNLQSASPDWGSHTCISALRRLRQEDQESKDILSYKMRPYLKPTEC